MKGLILRNPGELFYEEFPSPIPQSGEALIAVKAVGICGSDLAAYLGSHPWCKGPIILGHEVVGEIVEVKSDGKTQFAVGDLVAIDPVVECGHCYPCRIGRYNCCSQMKIIGIDLNGGLAQYLVAPLHRLHKIPQGMSVERGVLCEPLSVGAQAINRAHLHPADFVVIMGGGPIGLCTLLMAKTQKITVVVADYVPERLVLATSLGADAVLNLQEQNIAEVVMEMTKGEGANVVVEASGTVQGTETALEIASAGSRIIIVGLTKKPTPFLGATLVKKEMSIIASRLNTNLFPSTLQVLANPEFPAEKLITHQASFE